MENEKKVYETPEVTKVEFDASDRITASGCGVPEPQHQSAGVSYCAT